MAAQAFTLVAEAVQGQFGPTSRNVPSSSPTTATIAMRSTDFPTDATLSFRLFIEESFDGGSTWQTASGFPTTAIGGQQGRPTKGGGTSDGLPDVMYFYDGRARQLRITASPFVGGTPDAVVTDPDDPLSGLLAGSVPGSFDWGLTVTLQ